MGECCGDETCTDVACAQKGPAKNAGDESDEWWSKNLKGIIEFWWCIRLLFIDKYIFNANPIDRTFIKSIRSE